MVSKPTEITFGRLIPYENNYTENYTVYAPEIISWP